jgi:Tol biopolymer transport system component
MARFALRESGSGTPRPSDRPPAVAGPARQVLPGWIVISATLEGTGEPDLWLLRPDGSRRIRLTDNSERYSMHPCFSPDGRRIAFIRGAPLTGSNSLWICDTDGGAQREVVTPVGGTERFLSPVWISNHSVFYVRDPVLDRRPDLEVWSVSVDAAHGQPRLQFRFLDGPTGDNGLVTDASPDFQQLAVIAQSHAFVTTSNVYLTDRDGRRIETLWRDDPDDFQDSRALWSPSGDRVAWHHTFSRPGVLDAAFYGIGLALRGEDGTWSSRLQPNDRQRVTPLAWSPDGMALLCARMSADESEAHLFLMNDRFETIRELFSVNVTGWHLGQRAAGRLADWALVPDEIIPPDRD